MVPDDLPFLERKLSCSNLDLEILVEHGFLVPKTGASIALARG